MSEIQSLKDQVEDAVSDIRNGISNMEDALERYKRCLDNTLCDTLNELITFGFVPGAVLKFDGKPFIFKGYTEDLGMLFMNAESSILNGGSVETVHKYLGRWSK